MVSAGKHGKYEYRRYIWLSDFVIKIPSSRSGSGSDVNHLLPPVVEYDLHLFITSWETYENFSQMVVWNRCSGRWRSHPWCTLVFNFVFSLNCLLMPRARSRSERGLWATIELHLLFLFNFKVQGEHEAIQHYKEAVLTFKKLRVTVTLILLKNRHKNG